MELFTIFNSMAQLYQGFAGRDSSYAQAAQLTANAKAQRAASYANAAQIETNAKANVAAENSARQLAGLKEARENRMRVSTIKAQYAKSGVSMSGTPALMLREQIKTDEENMILGGKFSQNRNAMTTWTARTQANQLRHEGDLTLWSGMNSAKALKKQGKNSMWGGVIGAVGTLGSSLFDGED